MRGPGGEGCDINECTSTWAIIELGYQENFNAPKIVPVRLWVHKRESGPFRKPPYTLSSYLELVTNATKLKK